MANSLHSILAQWFPRRDELLWVLASVVDIQGSNYRKLGAMLLVNELGECFGLISGGCLEKALLVEVKKVLAFSKPVRVIYDSNQDSPSPWAAALGCGGKVTILLQPISTKNYLKLDVLYHALELRQQVFYYIDLNQMSANGILNDVVLAINSIGEGAQRNTSLVNDEVNGLMMRVCAKPSIHLAIFGGGIDAIPVVKMAIILGWTVSVIDNRVGYAQENLFDPAVVIREQINSEIINKLIGTIDASVVMTHNLDMDALAISLLYSSGTKYIGLLGPTKRKEQVLARVNRSGNTKSIHGPMGLDLGGDLPESIALSVLAECHKVLVDQGAI